MIDHPITHQHTSSFPETGESVTLFISDTRFGFHFGLALNHKGEQIKWCSHFESICSIPSKVNSEISYIYLTDYWLGNNIRTETVLLAKTCKAHHSQALFQRDEQLADKSTYDNDRSTTYRRTQSGKR